jgi:hypothetical protein
MHRLGLEFIREPYSIEKTSGGLHPGVSQGHCLIAIASAKRSGAPAAAPGSRSVSELETEVAKLRKELAMEHMEKR